MGDTSRVATNFGHCVVGQSQKVASFHHLQFETIFTPGTHQWGSKMLFHLLLRHNLLETFPLKAIVEFQRCLMCY